MSSAVANLIYDLLDNPQITLADLRTLKATLANPAAPQTNIAAEAGVSRRQVVSSQQKLAGLGVIDIYTTYHYDQHEQRPKRQNRYAPKVNAAAHSAAPNVNGSALSDATLPRYLANGPNVNRSAQYTLNTTTTINKNTQLVLVENDNQQNLGTLDIEAQQLLIKLGINPNLTQPGKRAPKICKRYTPAEILMFHDSEGSFAANLCRWAEAWRRGIDVTEGGKLLPALIWTKICEGQQPPDFEPDVLEGDIEDQAAEIARQREIVNARREASFFAPAPAPPVDPKQEEYAFAYYWLTEQLNAGNDAVETLNAHFDQWYAEGLQKIQMANRAIEAAKKEAVLR